MSVLTPPQQRVCEICGRTDVWDGDNHIWRIATDDDGTKLAGSRFCLHEWDINGSFNPFDGEA